MCNLCEEYGDGGIWYLNPLNYARNMYKLREPGKKAEGPGVYLEGGAEGGPGLPELMKAIEKGDQQAYDKVRTVMHKNRFTGGGSQILPLKDADAVLQLCSPIGLIACICRNARRAIDERNEMEYTCMGMGVGMLKWERWPERYKGGVKLLNVDEAKEWNHRMDKRGFVHALMLFGAPYIGGFCQCVYPDCGALQWAVDWGIGTIKSHYVAAVDNDLCNGCGVCAQRCQFGAIKFESTRQKSNIDPFKCFGCGLCETGCPRQAISLLDRKSLPELADVWTGSGSGLLPARKQPRITIDKTKCTVPFQCKKCLQVCPTTVFHVWRDIKREERLKEMDPRIDGNYELSVSLPDRCTACGKCADVCPVGAITIEIPQESKNG